LSRSQDVAGRAAFLEFAYCLQKRIQPARDRAGVRLTGNLLD
jgi:hypothetical protein